MSHITGSKVLTATEIAKHDNASDLWIVVAGKVWDVTEFAPSHPGGFGIILKYAGKDATDAYSNVHTPTTLTESLSQDKLKGIVDRNTMEELALQPRPAIAKAPPGPTSSQKPSLDRIISTFDFEEVASKTLAVKTWAFYSSAAADVITKRMNASCLDEIMLRPRMLIDVTKVSTEQTILGCRTGVPFYISPAAMAKLVHPDGEIAVAKGCREKNVIQVISTSASYPPGEIVKAGGSQQPFFFQLYVNKDRTKSEHLLAQVKALGIKAIFVTIDSPVPGKREADERAKDEEDLQIPNSFKKKINHKGGGYARSIGGFVDASLTWKDIAWLRKHWSGRIVLKGVMTAMDAKLAVEHKLEGIVLSNHGGRNLDTSPASILLLLELQRNCPEVFDQLEVLIDGGIRRGTDIFKALCLGAKGVGVGRGFLYALNYGQAGIEKYVKILKEELETTMRLCGVTHLSQVHPGLVNTLAIDYLVPDSDNHPYATWQTKANL
ncbi:L-lactate dehydrogenase (cytochrome) [Fusarium oxysporum f. sp. pisi HDV247]|uniref:L-lactate dehydrogenase (cytochrome) n=1 Tax=Fusarium oxysporum f. sp. pisi HDV247 TaxID=1080344 RepID=W9N6X5_FUSOX|nr:L-lactate dehydrogenase (cytochrome) [Fusarium oxysporum f. sp. pisi HDV247]